MLAYPAVYIFPKPDRLAIVVSLHPDFSDDCRSILFGRLAFRPVMMNQPVCPVLVKVLNPVGWERRKEAT